MNKRQKLLSTYLLALVCTVAAAIIMLVPAKVYAASKTAVSLNKTTAYLVGGETTTLKVKGVSSATKVTWASTNKKVITVSSKGVVTAQGVGTAYAKATVGGKTYKCKVIVVDPAAITLSPISNSVLLYDTMDLNPTSTKYTAAQIKAMKLTYRVTDTTKATVSSTGVITAKDFGSFYVTAYVHGQKIKTIKMTVTDYVDMTGVEATVDKGAVTYVKFPNGLRPLASSITVKTLDDTTALAEFVTTTIDGEEYVDKIKITGVYPGIARIEVNMEGFITKFSVAVGISPVDAVKNNDFSDYTGVAKETLMAIRKIMEDNNMFSETLSTREKLEAFQLYLNANTSYSLVFTNPKHITLLSAMALDGIGWCEGYATIFSFVCDVLDIPCYYVGGTVKRGHAWNRVQIDGVWYYWDATFNASLNSLEYSMSEKLWDGYRIWDDYEKPYSEYTHSSYPYIFTLGSVN